MPTIWRWALLALAVGPLAGSAVAADCAVARDPRRCAAQQVALLACADARGAEKRACIAASLPPPDCTRAPDRRRCEREARAQAACRTYSGKQLTKCLRDEGSREAGKTPNATSAGKDAAARPAR